jgi:hypothetical protein
MAARVREINAWTSSITNNNEPFRSNMHPQDEALNDLDLSDYINVMVNTVRSANRNEREGRDPFVSGLLSNYLSAQGLGAGVGESGNNDADTALARLIRTTADGRRNGDGPGICHCYWTSYNQKSNQAAIRRSKYITINRAGETGDKLFAICKSYLIHLVCCNN